MAESTQGIRQRYNSAFLEALEQLNPRQREAVEHIEGPVLVVAGPGTGKTHLLAARVGRILMETDARPQNILCLTFTDAAVTAMRERLLRFIGPAAHRTPIFTFHAFCNSVIQDNLELFGPQDLEPVTDLERIEIVRRLIDRLDVNHPLKRGRADPYFYESHLRDLFQRMKMENWRGEDILPRIEAYVADLPHRPAFVYQRAAGAYKKGELKEAKIEEERRRMERLAAAVSLFPAYEAAMAAARRYDYDDMILWVLRAFAENEALLRGYQERFLYFLVDEYQDTNGAQNQVLRRLAEFWPNPNVFIVGDDDQSIYEFQGARLKNLSDFHADYREHLKLVLLSDNYRSSQPILDAARALIGHNHIRIVHRLRELGLVKVLTARAKVAPRPPILITYPNRLHEETDIVAQIEAFRRDGISLSEMAVIYAQHKQARRLIRLLDKKGIPYNARRRVDILHLPLVANLRDILDYLDRETRRPFSGESLLFRWLHFPYHSIVPADVAKLSLRVGTQNNDLRHWREAIGDKALLEQLPLERPHALLDLSKLIEEWLTQAHSLPLPIFLERIINRGGILSYVLNREDRDWQIQVLKTFFDFVQREAERRPRLSPGQLLDILRRMDENRLPLELNQEIRSADGVHLVSAHSAKGLEFRCVFLIDCVKDYWTPRGRDGQYRFPLPDTLAYSGEEDTLEARRRLFYVAMTRAKEYLIISCSRQDHQGKALQRTQFIDELDQESHLVEYCRELPDTAIVDAQALYLRESASPVLPQWDRALIDHLLRDFRLSVSAWNRYLRCPLSFFHEFVLQIPVQGSEAAHYGIAAHQALQRLFERMRRSSEKAFPNEDALRRLFEQEMARLKSYFSPGEYQRRLEMGRQALPAYYRQCRPAWPKDARVEYNIRHAESEGVPLKGVIDRVDAIDAQHTRIVDYKTGQSDTSRLKKPSEANPHGGAYWRQLYFYKILHDSYLPEGPTAIEGLISYLDPDSDGRFPEKTIIFEPQDVLSVKRSLRETYDKIMAHDFYQGCGRPSCVWCQFTRHNIFVDSFADPETEDLDDAFSGM